MSIENVKNRLDSLKQAYIEQGRIELNDAFLDIFQKHPTLNAIGWRQYAPYFNDGDPCEFSVREYLIYVDIDAPQNESDDKYDDNWFYAAYDLDDNSSVRDKITFDVKTVLNNIPGEIFESIYGNDAEIIIARDGNVAVHEYTDHD